MLNKDFITITNAQTHNLKNVSVSIPKNKITVITGVSGSGKSSLAFDTVYAEGQRRYIESLSSYARQFLPNIDKPQVEEISGLIPTIAIDQKTASHNPRSTVGTITEIYDYFRVLFARVGVSHCPSCDKELNAKTKYEILNDILNVLKPGEKFMVLSSVIYNQKGNFYNLFINLKSKGFTKVRADDVIYNLDEQIPLDPNKKHNVQVIVDRLQMPENSLQSHQSDNNLESSKSADQLLQSTQEFNKRLLDALEQAISIGNGDIIINLPYSINRPLATEVSNIDNRKTSNVDNTNPANDTSNLPNQPKDLFYSTTNSCINCGLYFPKLDPNLFSFNSHYGACPKCQGLGYIEYVNTKDLYDPEQSFDKGGFLAVIPKVNTSYFKDFIKELLKFYKEKSTTKLKDLNSEILDIVFYGIPENHKFGLKFHYTGLALEILQKYHNADSRFIKRYLGRFIFNKPCEQCKSSGLNSFSLSVKVNNYTILDLTNKPIKDLIEVFNEIKFTGNAKFIADKLLYKIKKRLHFLQQVGLDYVTLNRRANTLSGGEAQRVRLAAQLGTGLTGILYVLDEPSIGLHMKDVNNLIKTIKDLCDQGNTILIVEHDLSIMKCADYIIEIGPNAGVNGGNLIFEGNQEDFWNCKDCLTPKYLDSYKQKVRALMK